MLVLSCGVIIDLKSESPHAVDVALVAVRGTQVVKNAYKAERLPRSDKQFSLSRFNGTRRLPNLNKFQNAPALQCSGLTMLCPSFRRYIQMPRRHGRPHLHGTCASGPSLSHMIGRSSDVVVKTATSTPFPWREDSVHRRSICFKKLKEGSTGAFGQTGSHPNRGLSRNISCFQHYSPDNSAARHGFSGPW